MNIKITKLTICGIKNITEPVSFSFCKKTFNQDTDFSEFNIKGIYGENGSGKTACVYAVHILKNIAIDRNYLKDESTQRALLEIVNKITKKGFIEEEYFISINDTSLILQFKLGFRVNERGRFEITEESLKRKKATSSQNKFLDVYRINEGKLTYFCDKKKTKYIEDISKNILLEQSLCSVLFDHYLQKKFDKSNDFDDFVYGFLLSMLNTKIYIDKLDNYKEHFYYTHLENLFDTSTDTGRNLFASAVMARHYSQREYSYVVNKSSYDSFRSYIDRINKFIKLFKTDLKNVGIDAREDENDYICNLILEYKKYNIDLKFESTGIKKLFQIFNYLEACSNGYVVFVDELDTSINSIYLNKILEYFSRFGDGQLCFTAHNLGTMSVLKQKRKAIDFLSSVNTVHTWSKEGNLDPENAYRRGFVEDSPFNVAAEDFIGVIGG